MNKVPDHPDIVSAERTGYPRSTRPDNEVIGYCLNCDRPITRGEKYLETERGLNIFCDDECAFSYYEFEEILPY